MTASAAVFHPAGKMLLIFFVFLKGWCFGSTQPGRICQKKKQSCRLRHQVWSNCHKKNNFYPPFFSDQTLVHSWEISAGRKDVVCKWLLHFCPKTSFLGNTHHHLEITNIVHLQKHTLWVCTYKISEGSWLYPKSDFRVWTRKISRKMTFHCFTSKDVTKS